MGKPLKQPAKQGPSGRARDREATERALLEAAQRLIAREGYSAFGVNAVAREAGCDKQLIYRYFGGPDGLIEAIGEAAASWIEAVLKQVHTAPGSPYSEVVAAYLEALLNALRSDSLMRQLISWEMTGTGQAVERMARVRSAAMAKRIIPLLRAAAPPPPGVDAAAVNALLIGAVQQVAMSGAAQGALAGMPLASDADWARMKAALSALIRGIYGAAT